MKNNKQIKIAIISHAQVIPVFQNRWKHLAEDKSYEINLLLPQYWEQTWFGEKVVYRQKEKHDGNFHVYPLPTTSVRNWGRYLFRSIDAKLRVIRPDLIYIIHEEGILIHHQIYFYRKFFAPNAKIIFFSMNAKGVPYTRVKNLFKKIIHKWMWNNIKKNTDAALVHYPGCLESLRKGGYERPIYLQTQVGVDETLFLPDFDIRQQYRKKLGFEDKFVVGYTGRLTIDKGVDDLVAIFVELAKKNKFLALLLVGNGVLKEELEALFSMEGLESRTHITGFVDQAEVPAYMNVMDTFVLGSKTTPHWLDTFPLVTVQAQSVGVPVIASDSASIPWQLADSAKIFPEGNRGKLQEALIGFIENENQREHYAQAGQKRSHKNFCHQGMTDNFKKIVAQVLTDSCVYHKNGEEYTQWKAYL